MKKAIVTGATGFIGKFLVRELVKQNVEVIAVVRRGTKNLNTINALPVKIVECNIADYHMLPDMIADRDIDVVFHIAWQGVSDLDARNEAIQMQNLQSTLDLIDAMHIMRIGCFIGCGSMHEAESLVEMNEDKVISNLGYMYKATKTAAHWIGKAKCGTYGIRFFWPLINTYGEEERSARLVNTIIRKVLHGESPDLSAGNQYYDFVHVSDVARALILIAEKGVDGTNYTIGSGDAKPLSDARNAGITIAQGEFLLFVDSDDCIEKDLCESCMNVMDADVDIVAFNYRRVYDTYSENKKECGVFEKFSNLEGFKRYINRTPFTHMAWDKLYRKCVFEDVRYPVDRLAEDMATTYKTFKNANKVGYLDRVLYNYFIRSDSIMGGKSLKLLLDAYQGEVEAYKYGNKYYPTLLVQNNTRFLNQSMKTYLKLIKNFSNNNEGIEDERKSVLINIQEIDKRHMPFKTMLFYCCFRFNKDFAWMVFKKFHLS